VALLLRHGVDPNGQGTRHPIHQGRGALELARANGCAAVKALLLGAGATGPAEDAVDALVSAAMRGDERVADASPELVAAAVARRPGQVRVAAERGRHGAVRLLAALGFDPNHLYGTTALHEAALRGDHALVDLLLALGADPSIRDVRFHATPAGWADHQGHAALAAELRAREQTG
jgi:ankyrin repeat protein